MVFRGEDMAGCRCSQPWRCGPAWAAGGTIHEGPKAGPPGHQGGDIKQAAAGRGQAFGYLTPVLCSISGAGARKVTQKTGAGVSRVRIYDFFTRSTSGDPGRLKDINPGVSRGSIGREVGAGRQTGGVAVSCRRASSARVASSRVIQFSTPRRPGAACAWKAAYRARQRRSCPSSSLARAGTRS